MIQKLLLSLTGVATLSCALANTDSIPSASKPPSFTINGSADIYYRYDLRKSASNNLTSFTGSHDQFALGMASIKLEHKTDKVDVVADLGFGKRASDFSYNDNGLLSAVKQLYVSYSPGSNLKLTAGTWATHVGYELVDPQLNRNYSMSYMFTNGPFTHTGIKADLSLGKSSFMIGLANPTDMRVVPAGVMNKKFLIAQYGYAASDAVKFYLNFVGGKGTDTAKSEQFDLVATAKLSDRFGIGFNATMNNSHRWVNKGYTGLKQWYGTAIYLNYDPKPWMGFTWRTEYFNDKDGQKLAAGGNVVATTLSANFKVDGFIFIPELRADLASKGNFIDKGGSNTKNAYSLVLAAIYSF